MESTSVADSGSSLGVGCPHSPARAMVPVAPCKGKGKAPRGELAAAAVSWRFLSVSELAAAAGITTAEWIRQDLSQCRANAQASGLTAAASQCRANAQASGHTAAPASSEVELEENHPLHRRREGVTLLRLPAPWDKPGIEDAHPLVLHRLALMAEGPPWLPGWSNGGPDQAAYRLQHNLPECRTSDWLTAYMANRDNDGLPIAASNLSDARPVTLVPARPLAHSVAPPPPESRSSGAASSSESRHSHAAGPFAIASYAPNPQEAPTRVNLCGTHVLRPTAAQLLLLGPPVQIYPAKAPPPTLRFTPAKRPPPTPPAATELDGAARVLAHVALDTHGGDRVCWHDILGDGRTLRGAKSSRSAASPYHLGSSG